MSLSEPAPLPRRVGRPARISHADVVRAALELADEHGIESLSLRVVADRLDVTPASLYRLIDGPHDLHRIVVEAALEEAVDGLTLQEHWRPAMQSLAHVIHAALVRHPLLVQAYQRGLVRSPGADAAVNKVLSALLRAGLDEQEVVDVYAAVHGYVVGFTALEQRRSVLSSSDYVDPQADEVTQRLRESLVERYYRADAFGVGLSLLLDGIEQRLRQQG